LLLAPDENTRKGKRDGALLGLLVGCGLWRSELVSLVVGKIQMRDDRWVIPDLVGKRKKLRLVPVPGWVKDRLDLWTQAAKITEGKIFRAVRKNDKVSGASLSTTAVSSLRTGAGWFRLRSSLPHETNCQSPRISIHLSAPSALVCLAAETSSCPWPQNLFPTPIIFYFHHRLQPYWDAVAMGFQWRRWVA
jgi:integrase